MKTFSPRVWRGCHWPTISARILHLAAGSLLKKKLCPHAHIVNGLQVQGEITNYPCLALRWIYVPKDSSIRKVLVIHNNTGHNYPAPALSKVALGRKDTYRQCIQANGGLGATVSKIENAQSTKMLLGGKTPVPPAAPLYNKRAKRSILHAEKLEKYPNGLGVNVTSFDGDTTFKGTEGEMNEWELKIFAQRAVSVLRAYINGSSADFFELLFDELQRKLEVTGKPITFKIFVTRT
ncbi:hypothetical protein K438DRAFT_2021341 [Mycena galopus ATCC 62051]|nr:hypothetical protein K438DRAFT_2021341 [Mycena galopus ATCC 62051]